MLAQDEAEKLFDLKALETPPKVVSRRSPVYPYNQSRAGLTGRVSIEFIIDREGQVRNAYVIESNNPAFERPALDAVLAWKFKPGLKNGHPVNTRATQVIEFELGNGGTSPWQITKPRSQANLPPELQWDEAPEPSSTTFPVYPLAALQAGVKGKTSLRFIIGPDGRVVQSRVVEATTPELGQAALAMIDTWRFKPARKKDGSLASAMIGIEHEFSPSGRGDVPVSDSARNILRLLEKHPEKIVAASQLDRPPKPLLRRSPVYPTALLEAAQPGEATIEFFIDEKGDAQLPRIVSSTAVEFGYSGVQAVASWHFEPPMKSGMVVVARAKIPLSFKLRSEDARTSP